MYIIKATARARSLNSRPTQNGAQKSISNFSFLLACSHLRSRINLKFLSFTFFMTEIPHTSFLFTRIYRRRSNHLLLVAIFFFCFCSLSKIRFLLVSPPFLFIYMLYFSTYLYILMHHTHTNAFQQISFECDTQEFAINPKTNKNLTPFAWPL